MKLGKIKISLIIFVFGFFTNSYSEDRILSAPIINLESLEPSYEGLDSEKDVISTPNTKIKKRNNKQNNGIIKFVNLMGLDKITAKTFL